MMKKKKIKISMSIEHNSILKVTNVETRIELSHDEEVEQYE